MNWKIKVIIKREEDNIWADPKLSIFCNRLACCSGNQKLQFCCQGHCFIIFSQPILYDTINSGPDIFFFNSRQKWNVSPSICRASDFYFFAGVYFALLDLLPCLQARYMRDCNKGSKSSRAFVVTLSQNHW